MIHWRPLSEAPADLVATAMIRHTDEDGAHLMPGPVAWSAARGAWVSENTGEPVKFADTGTFHWVPEGELL